MNSAFFGTIIKTAGQKFYDVDGNFLIECMIDDLGNKNSNDEKLIYIENIIDYCKTQLYEYEILNKNDDDFEIIHKASNEFIKKIKNIKMTYDEKNIKEPEQQKGKKEKEIKKFQWNDTEKSLLLIIELLYNSEFITQDSFQSRFAVIRDTFINESGNSFNNKQLAVTYSNDVSPLISREKKIEKDDNIYRKLDKLKKLLVRLIPD